MIRNFLWRALVALFLFWLFWPRAWMPDSWVRHDRALNEALARAPALRLFPGVPTLSLPGQPRERAGACAGGATAAVLAFTPEADSFSAAAALRAAGISYCATSDPAQAFSRRLVVVAQQDHPLPRDAASRQAARAFVDSGGALVLQGEAAQDWKDLAGLTAARASRARRLVVFASFGDDALAALASPALRRLPLAAPASPEAPWTWRLFWRGGDATPLAFFDGGRRAAVCRRRIGDGEVYALGFGLRDAVVRARAGRTFGLGESGSGEFTPGADAAPLLLLGIARAFEPGLVRLRPLPGEARGVLALGHSIEPGVDPEDARALGRWEAARGLRATYFTRVDDGDAGADGPLYDHRMISVLRELSAEGHELAAHTFVHSPDFASLPPGTGIERPGDYRPDTDAGRDWDATARGELRVPRLLLRRDVPGARGDGFRSPFCAYPDWLALELMAAGYSYDSSLTSARAQSHRPFLLPLARRMDAESRIVELPMTFEDEEASAAAPPSIADVRRVLADIAAEEGVAVWQSRPSPQNLERLRDVLEGLPPGTVVRTYGETSRWWYARESADFSVTAPAHGRRTLTLRLPRGVEGSELSFEAQSAVGRCRARPAAARVSCAGRLIVVLNSGGAREVQVDFAAPPALSRREN